MSKSSVFKNIVAAYMNDRSRNELAQTLLNGGPVINRDQRMYVYKQSYPYHHAD